MQEERTEFRVQTDIIRIAMKKRALLLLVLAATSVVNAEASTTALSAKPATAVLGDTVTFTAAFTSSCAGALTSHYFTIDGQNYNGTFAQSGKAGTETLSIATLTAGSHSLSYNWKINGTFCRGVAYLTYTVAPQPSPSPSPSPPPSPRSSPSPTPSAGSVIQTLSPQGDT